MREFDGKTVLITGGGSGIGLGAARRLIEAGANVALAGRSTERLEQAAKELGGKDHVLTAPTDVSDLGDLDRLIAAIRDRFGTLDGVFANAGTGVAARTAELSEADFDRVIGTNLKGVFFTVQKALPLLADGSSVVLNSSWTAHRGMAAGSLYGASKAGLPSLTRSLASDLAERGIRVNTVTPGHIHTEMLEAITGSDEVREIFRSQVALGRLGRPDDVADAVLFLLSSRSSYITGQELVIDGGLVSCVPS
ncbi:SDR family NAD(P)-dependent oxidoreductase [Amycolatopsis arida]|nr:SDR family oxidoreductase [Amycolatopsis arida]